MKVQIIRESKFQAVGPAGPITRIFAVGEVLDLPELHAQMLIAQKHAVLPGRGPKTAPEAAVDEAPKVTKAAPKKTR